MVAWPQSAGEAAQARPAATPAQVAVDGASMIRVPGETLRQVGEERGRKRRANGGQPRAGPRRFARIEGGGKPEEQQVGRVAGRVGHAAGQGGGEEVAPVRAVVGPGEAGGQGAGVERESSGAGNRRGKERPEATRGTGHSQPPFHGSGGIGRERRATRRLPAVRRATGWRRRCAAIRKAAAPSVTLAVFAGQPAVVAPARTTMPLPEGAVATRAE